MHIRFAVVVACFIFGPTAWAQDIQIKDLENAINATQTLEADFVQTNPDHSTGHGKFYLKRPHQLRFNYIEPVDYFILAQDGWLLFHDPTVDDPSYLEVEFSPAKFLLQDRISLQEGVKIINFYRDNGLIYATLTDDNQSAFVTLKFQESPLQLKGWEIVDGQQQVTKVALDNIIVNAPLDAKIFRHHKKPRRR